MPASPADLWTSPDHYLHSFDGADAVFVPMDRAAYRASIFLDRRIVPARGGAMRIDPALLPAPSGPAGRVQWIFHIAHCGSTLLARALDELGDGLVLREPLALRQAALEPDPARLALVLHMLGKSYSGEGPNLVKANVPVNFILPAIARHDPSAAAILLHYPLRDYLLAILRSENHRRWVDNVAGLLAHHLGDLSGLSQPERAAALWLAQMQRFGDAVAAMPNARTLDAERFFTEPAACLTQAAAHLGTPADPARIARLVSGPLFATYSKNPGVAFDNAARLARRAALEGELAGELDAAETWLSENGGAQQVLEVLAGARLG